MICPECRGRGFVPIGETDDDETAHGPCSYCDGYTEAEIERSQRRIGFILDAAYRDDSYPERTCERCSALYRGPAVYCCLECAAEDL